MPLLFSYGTLQDEPVQVATFGRKLDGAPDRLPGFEAMLLGGAGSHKNAGYKGDGAATEGTLFEVTKEELAKADEYEQPARYVRIAVKLASDKDAWAYVSEPHLRTSKRMRFIEHVGVEFHESGPGTSIATLQVQVHHFNTVGVVHGGAIFTLADTGMAAALIPDLKEGESCATSNLTINYFRPVLSGPIVCTSRIVNRGKTLANIEGECHVAGKLIARANGTWAVFARR
ncbi:MAG TPA: hotdog fold thioesterase [Usitatibacter sp.]|nr:hotdog fold thioesterase [Usitatibacter sp.]